ncbi:putative F-box/LRR-repeat protein [Platanthera zijinensis]|uniref:F-box/LRR-repeat protein n=1 Tax=Platanthera zijinensis TaxID=2320716 RepID=A0AAP0G0M0_9ASPA
MAEVASLEVTGGDFVRPSKINSSESCDRISQLHDSLLLHIISFLSADDAISTSLLSRRWKNLWKWMDSLDFPFQCAKSKRSLKQFIERALTLHEGLKIKRFCARFHYNSNYVSHVDSWVHYMIARNVEKLVLDFFFLGNGVQPYVLPPSVYNCGSLRELEVNLCGFRLPTIFCLGSLEKLVVSNGVFVGNTLRDLISGCPVLEDLVLVNCNQACDLDVVVLNRKLKRLKIVEYPDEVEEGTVVKIYAPYLLHLELQSGDPRPYIILNAGSIYSASLDMRRIVTCLSLDTYNQKNYFQILEDIMIGLHEVKSLRLSSWCVQALLEHEDMHRCLPTPFRYLKHLKLVVKLAKDELPGIACLLWNSPELEHLTIQLCKQTHIDKEKVESAMNANGSLSNWSEESLWDCHRSTILQPEV